MNQAIEGRTARRATACGGYAEAMSPIHGPPADLPEDLEQLRARARERDQFLDLLRRSRADSRTSRSESGASERRSVATSRSPCCSTCFRAGRPGTGGGGGRAGGGHRPAGSGRGPGAEHVPQRAPAARGRSHEGPRAAVRPGPAPRGDDGGGCRSDTDTVVRVLKEGYRIHDRVLRAAEVVVAADARCPGVEAGWGRWIRGMQCLDLCSLSNAKEQAENTSRSRFAYDVGRDPEGRIGEDDMVGYPAGVERMMAGSSTRSRRATAGGMRPSRPPSWATAGSSTSPPSWGATPRPSARAWRELEGDGRAGHAAASVKRGRTQAADRDRPDDRGQLPQGARGPHRGRPDAAGGAMDQPVAAADRRAGRPSWARRSACTSSRNCSASTATQAEGAEDEDDGAAPSRPQRPVREHRPAQAGVPGGRPARSSAWTPRRRS